MSAPGPGDSAPLIFIVAGEPSGDALGGPLMAALKAETGGSVHFAGVGGEAMRAEGLESLFPIGDLAVMGLLEVLPSVPRILRRIRETAGAIRELKPAAVVTIDSPDFSQRVWKRVAGLGIPLVHYVAPTVWAWRAGRVRNYARYLDHILVLLPFEPRYFEDAGLAATFVGHPVVDGGAAGGDGARFRARHGIDPASTLVCILPGSRRGEVARHLGVFRDAIARLKDGHPGLRCVLPTLPHLEPSVAAEAAAWPVPLTVVTDIGEKFDAMAACDAALAASGTVALELAAARVPTVVAYRVNPATAALVRRIVRVRYVNLVNILLDRPAVPELLQERCRPDMLARELRALLDDPDRRRAQQEATAEALAMLRSDGEAPSRRAARRILDVIEERTG